MSTQSKRYKILTRLVIVALLGIFSFWVYKTIRYKDTSTPITICVQPLAFANQELLNHLKKDIQNYYHFNVIILENKELPTEAYYQPRNRYKASKLIWWLWKIKPNNTDYIIGISAKDISTKKGDNPDFGIMGLGFCPGKSSVISTYRIKTPNQTLLKERLSKIALHEIGHNLGLGHCSITRDCFMHAAEASIKQIDREKLDLCANCKKMIHL